MHILPHRRQKAAALLCLCTPPQEDRVVDVVLRGTVVLKTTPAVVARGPRRVVAQRSVSSHRCCQGSTSSRCCPEVRAEPPPNPKLVSSCRCHLLDPFEHPSPNPRSVSSRAPILCCWPSIHVVAAVGNGLRVKAAA
jgi:hypothetical protein